MNRTGLALIVCLSGVSGLVACTSRNLYFPEGGLNNNNNTA